MPQSSPSIILVVYNGMKYLPDCLASVMEECQATPRSEVVVVDNASTDGSAGWVAANYPGVKLVRQKKNVGFAAGANLGAALASGDVLVFLNQDTRVLPGWLRALVDFMFNEDYIGLTTSRLLYMNQPGQVHLLGQEVLYTGMIFGRGSRQPADAASVAQAVGAVSGASFAIRRELWERLGGFDEDFFMYYEETDLSWRAALLGFRSWYVPESVALHDANSRPSLHATYYSVRNRPRLLLKHWKWQTLVLISPALLLTELLEWAYLLRLGPQHAVNKLRASARLFTHPGQLLRARHLAQIGRIVKDAQLLVQCAYGLTPSKEPASTIGRGLVRVANWLLWINYSMAVKLARWWNI
ncbi:MAG: glycosyltransferase family 2 protein [Anaerolineales bacterium]|jgi:hypothetical protein|nr:glycosyltransferase family 2 protein [Anaerolineales bacterium]